MGRDTAISDAPLKVTWVAREHNTYFPNLASIKQFYNLNHNFNGISPSRNLSRARNAIKLNLGV